MAYAAKTTAAREVARARERLSQPGLMRAS